MDRGLGNDELRTHANNCHLPTMDLGQVTKGCALAYTTHGPSEYVCARAHLYAHTVHFFWSTVDLGLTHRLCISYPIPTTKLKKIA